MVTNRLKQCQYLLECSSDVHVYYKIFEGQLNFLIRDEFINKFWSFFTCEFNKDDANSHEPLLNAMQFFELFCNQVEKVFDENNYVGLREKFFSALKVQILYQKPYYLNDYLEATYSRAFRTYKTLYGNESEKKSQRAKSFTGVEPEEQECDDDEDDDDFNEFEEYDSQGQKKDKSEYCIGCSSSFETCSCKTIYNKFCKMNEQLRRFDLLTGLIGETVMKVARLYIEKKVTAKGKANYANSYLEELTVWVEDTVKKWIVDIYNYTSTDDVNRLGQKLHGYLKDAYAEVRVSHMFEIIIEFPNSEAAIQDLKLCLEKSTSSNFRLNLIDSVKQSLIESLLHPGVNTYDILTAYISAIKALRALDPTGLILQLVTEPVRRYLKSRDDTVRCIVTALTDEDHNSELNREMIRSSAQTNENGIDGKSGSTEMNLPSEGEKCTALNFENWKPDPIKLSSSDELMKSSRFSDIVSILVNIYETKDLFVEEYQKLLSQRLLNKYYDCNLDTELRNLELLTIRFSDCELHRCEVMLKDVQTSKRINKRILSGDIRDQKLDNFKNLDVLIVSSPFWPEKFSPMASLSEEPPDIRFPSEIESAITTYTKAFEAIQASRTLHWRHHLGSVNLDLTINGRTQNFTVSPLHASLLYLFKEKKRWSLNEMMHKTSLPAATLRSRLALWQRNGLIREYAIPGPKFGEEGYVLNLD